MKLLDRFRTPPDCREVMKVLQTFLDEELVGPEVEVVTKHLEHCHRCGVEADVYRRVKQSLAELKGAPDHEALDRVRSFAAELVAADPE